MSTEWGSASEGWKSKEVTQSHNLCRLLAPRPDFPSKSSHARVDKPPLTNRRRREKLGSDTRCHFFLFLAPSSRIPRIQFLF